MHSLVTVSMWLRNQMATQLCRSPLVAMSTEIFKSQFILILLYQANSVLDQVVAYN